MKTYKTLQKPQQTLQSITCDVCKTEYTDWKEMDEMIEIYHDVGFSSIFGDCTIVELDMCQYCFKDKLGKYVRKTDTEGNEV